MSPSGSKCSRRKRIRDGVRKGSRAYAIHTSRDKPFLIVLVGTEGWSGCVTTGADYNFVRFDSKIPRCPTFQEIPMMRLLIRPIAALAILALAGACSHHVDLRKPASQDNFGVQMAKMNLWREALFRFARAVEINPGDAMADNNLAVAYEANGDFEKARKEYLEALKLDRTNQYIQKNYSRFVEFLSRNRKRQQKDTKTAAAAVPPSTTTPAPIAAAPASAADASQPAPAPMTPPPAPAPTPTPTSTQPPTPTPTSTQPPT